MSLPETVAQVRWMGIERLYAEGMTSCIYWEVVVQRTEWRLVLQFMAWNEAVAAGPWLRF